MTVYGKQRRAHLVALSRAADFQEQIGLVDYSCRKLRRAARLREGRKAATNVPGIRAQASRARTTTAAGQPSALKSRLPSLSAEAQSPCHVAWEDSKVVPLEACPAHRTRLLLP